MVLPKTPAEAISDTKVGQDRVLLWMRERECCYSSLTFHHIFGPILPPILSLYPSPVIFSTSSPYFASLPGPTPLTSSRSSEVCGRARAISISVLSLKTQ